MDSSNGTSRDYTLDAREEDGVRPLVAEDDAATADATDTGPNDTVSATGHLVVDQIPPETAPQDGATGGAQVQSPIGSVGGGGE